MAASEINDLIGTSTALTITLASLGSSTSGVGRQSDIIDNTTARYQLIRIYLKFKQGTSPTGNKSVYVYAIRDDNDATNHRTDGAGSADAALTVLNAPLVGVGYNKSSPATGDIIYVECDIWHPGKKWGIAVVHDTGVNADSTGGNHWARYQGFNPESQ